MDTKRTIKEEQKDHTNREGGRERLSEGNIKCVKRRYPNRGKFSVWLSVIHPIRTDSIKQT